LEQSQEWRLATERLNKELKKQLDDLKDYLDSEVNNSLIVGIFLKNSNFLALIIFFNISKVKGRSNPQDYNEMILVNKLYESMFREYFLQEQL
jgi:hypothetical protein